MRPVLVDVDGVLCNFVSKCVDFINNKNNLNIRHEDVVEDIVSYDWWDEECEKFVKSPGFCSDLRINLDGVWGIKELRKMGEKVIFVTSPYKGSPTWSYDRTLWLMEHFNAERDDVILCHDKRYVDGKILIDDHPRNIFHWEQYNIQERGGKGFLFNTPQNRVTKYGTYPFVRVGDWSKLIDKINHMKYEKEIK